MGDSALGFLSNLKFYVGNSPCAYQELPPSYIFLVFLLLFPFLVNADFQAGKDAYDGGDSLTALKKMAATCGTRECGSAVSA